MLEYHHDYPNAKMNQEKMDEGLVMNTKESLKD